MGKQWFTPKRGTGYTILGRGCVGGHGDDVSASCHEPDGVWKDQI